MVGYQCLARRGENRIPFHRLALVFIEGRKILKESSMLIKDYYSPAETVEIINAKLNPLPRLTVKGLSEIAMSGSLDVYAKSTKGTFKVISGMESLILECYRIETKFYNNFQAALDGEKKTRLLLGIPKYQYEGEIKDVPALWDAIFLKVDIEKFISVYEVEPTKGNVDSMVNWVQQKIKTSPQIRQIDLIKEAHEKYGYDEQGTAVKKAWTLIKDRT